MSQTNLWHSEPGTELDAKLYTDVGVFRETGYWAPVTVVGHAISANGGTLLMVTVMTWDLMEEVATPVLHAIPGVSLLRLPELSRGPEEYERTYAD